MKKLVKKFKIIKIELLKMKISYNNVKNKL